MKRSEKAKQLEILKESLLNPFKTKDELKEAKKHLTKFVNTLAKNVNKLSLKFKDLAWEANKDFQYDEKSELKSAVWFFVSVHPYINSLVKTKDNLKIIEKKYQELHKLGLEFWNNIKEEVEYVVKITEHITNEAARLKGSTVEQFLAAAERHRETSEEKRAIFERYRMSLKKWKPAEIKNGEIKLNGKIYNKGDRVGVMIGSGNRIHNMSLTPGIEKDKNTGKETEVIYITNYTQWRNSNLVIIDFIDNIPSELYAERS